jgi:hypothetical protein
MKYHKLLKLSISIIFSISLTSCGFSESKDANSLSKKDETICVKLKDSYTQILAREISSGSDYGKSLLDIKSISSNYYPEFENQELYNVVKEISNIEYKNEATFNRANFLNSLTKMITIQKICGWKDQVVDPNPTN